jgi:hypothetical protein
MDEICMLSYYQKLEYSFVRRDFSIGRATNLQRNNFTPVSVTSVYIPPVFCVLRCLMTDGSIQRTQLQCLTEAKAHGALPPHPPSNLDRMDKDVQNLNTKFKLSEKI